MTNILATVIVCLVTNVTWTDNSQTMPWFSAVTECDGGILPGSQSTLILPDGWYGQHDRTSEPTEKTKTTVIERVHVLSFKWMGQDMRAKVTQEVSRKVQTFKKREEWEEVK